MDNLHTSLVTFSFLVILSQAKGFNITSLLDHYSSFSNFNNYLTQTGVAGAINSRQTITLLVVDNGDLSPLQGMRPDVLANIMRVHVLLDYYDVQKLQTLPNKTVKVPTLFQTTGQAKHEQGFMNMTDLGTGSISLGSAAKGETLGSTLVKSIAAQPYNISILQISNVIIPLGIDSSTPSLPITPPRPMTPSPQPTPSLPITPSPRPMTPSPQPTPSLPITPPHPMTPFPQPTPSLPITPSPRPMTPSPQPTPSLPSLPPKHAHAPTPTRGAPTHAPASSPHRSSAGGTPAPAPHGLLPADTPTGASPDAPTANTPAGGSADAPTPTPTGDHGSSSASSILGVSLVFIAILNIFLVLVI